MTYHPGPGSRWEDVDVRAVLTRLAVVAALALMVAGTVALALGQRSVVDALGPSAATPTPPGSAAGGTPAGGTAP